MFKQVKKRLEAELVILLKEGSECAFEELFKRYEHKVFLYALKFTKSKESAEEILQDIFVKLWKYRAQIDLSLPLNALIFKIAKNNILNYLRDESKRQALKKEYGFTIETMRNLTEEKVFLDEYMEITHQAINKLPPQRKSIFIMSRFECKSYDEIANSLSISKDTVRNQLIKSLKSIRQHIQLRTGIPTDALVILFFIFQ